MIRTQVLARRRRQAAERRRAKPAKRFVSRLLYSKCHVMAAVRADGSLASVMAFSEAHPTHDLRETLIELGTFEGKTYGQAVTRAQFAFRREPWIMAWLASGARAHQERYALIRLADAHLIMPPPEVAQRAAAHRALVAKLTKLAEDAG